MKLSRNMVVGAIVGAVVAATAVYGVWYLQSDVFAYRGLVLQEQVESTDSQRAYFAQQLHTSQAALEVQKKTIKDSKEWDWDLYLAIAWNASALGDLVTAREALEEYFELNAINPAAWNLYGDTLNRMEDYRGAEWAFATATEVGPSEENFRDWVEAIRRNPTEGSREDMVKEVLETGVRQVGQTPWFMTELAMWYEADGQCSRAIEHFEVARGLLPEAAWPAVDQDIAQVKANCQES